MKTFVCFLLLFLGAGASALAQTQAQIVPLFGGSVVSGGSFIGTVNVGQPSFGTVTGGTMAMTVGTVYRWPGLGVTAVGEELPINFALWQNSPNPSAGRMVIRYDIPKGNAVPVRLDVYDVTGRQMTRLVDATQSPGRYAVNLDHHSASALSSGVYWYRLRAGSFLATKKLIILN